MTLIMWLITCVKDSGQHQDKICGMLHIVTSSVRMKIVQSTQPMLFAQVKYLFSTPEPYGSLVSL